MCDFALHFSGKYNREAKLDTFCRALDRAHALKIADRLYGVYGWHLDKCVEVKNPTKTG